MTVDIVLVSIDTQVKRKITEAPVRSDDRQESGVDRQSQEVTVDGHLCRPTRAATREFSDDFISRLYNIVWARSELK